MSVASTAVPEATSPPEDPGNERWR
ncbi:MAG: hypothetical protein QOJ12_452, partial [Thermoleophilales bacterium]|nr:hypothetical protein [Thermoleophilales bacterium]